MLKIKALFVIWCLLLLPLVFQINISSADDEKPEIFLPLGHIATVNSIAISPDGQYVISGSDDNTLKLWEVATGKEIRTFTGHSGGILSVAFSPDGRYALSGSYDNTLKLWEIRTGKEIRTFSGHKNLVKTSYFPSMLIGGQPTSEVFEYKGVKAVGFSTDGHFALSVGADNTLKLWDIATGREIRTFSGYDRVLISPDGRYVLTGYDGDRTLLKLLEVSTGKEIRTFSIPISSNESVVISPNGKYALSYSEETSLQLWEISTSREIRRWPLSNFAARVHSVVFSSDGRYVLSGSEDGAMRLWDVNTGNKIRTFSKYKLAELEHNVGQTISSVAFTPDGRYVLSALENAVTLWDISTGKKIRTFTGNTEVGGLITITPDGKYAVSGGLRTTSQLWDLNMGKRISSFSKVKEKEEWNVALLKVDLSIVISPDGQYALSGGYENTLKLWDIKTGKVIRKFSGESPVAFSPDGKYVLSGGEREEAEKRATMLLSDINTGKVIRTFPGCNPMLPAHFPENMPFNELIWNSVAFFSPDGRYAACSFERTSKLWEIKTGKQIKTFSKLELLAFSPDSKHVIANDNCTIRMLEITTGREIKSIYQPAGTCGSIINPDGRHVIFSLGDGSLKLWDMDTGREITFSGHEGPVLSAVVSPDGRYVITGSEDNTNRIWDVNTGKELAKMVSFHGGEWIVITPEGYYNSSLKGHQYLNIRMGLSVYGINQFYDVFYRPDIVTAKLRGEDISNLITLTIDDAMKSPPPSVEFSSTPKSSDKSKVKVCYNVKSTGGGIGEVRLFHNGKLIQSDGYYKDVSKTTSERTKLLSMNSKAIYEEMRSISLKSKADLSPITSMSKGESFEDCKEVNAISGENEISVTAFNSNNTIQSYMKTINFTAKVKAEEPHLYILSIGIDQYKDDSVNLKYAVKDSTDIEDKLLKQSATLYKPQNIHYTLLTNSEANKANITNKINELAQKIKPTDSFIFFVAGHGVLLHNQYYMLTSDYDGTVGEHDMISSNEIVEISKKIMALTQLFIFDTCHAGGVDYIVSGLYDARMSVLAKKMGLHIYASANSLQEAMDGYKGNGLFTYTLLDGLNNNKKADMNKDKKVSLVELGEYTKQTTSEISKKLGHSQTPLIINFGKDNPVYMIR